MELLKKVHHLILVFILALAFTTHLSSQALPDSILGHPVQKDAAGRLLPWFEPDIPGAGYVHVTRLASEFIKNAPLYEPLDLKMYFVTCCFHADENREIIAEDWMHNPACIWAGLVQGLVLDYRVYSGDESYIDIVREMLDYQLKHGTTPEEWKWPNVPYASADPFVREYEGAGRWEHDGMRGDGLHGIEPDKLGELGFAYLMFYQVTEEKRFLQAAVQCADVLAQYVRDVRPESRDFIAADVQRSPWPFRVNARTGVVLSEYCSNVIEPIKLLDELVRIGDRIDLTAAQDSSYRAARKIAWDWLFSINGPIKTGIWNAYFEDIPNDPDRSNRIQITPMETARYLINHPESVQGIEMYVPALIHWVASAFATDGFDAIKEQTWCYLPMGSHTSRYASVCARWYERTGDSWYKEQARRFFNYATYMCATDGVVSVGHSWPSCWWSDGYSDYIKHFMAGIAAIPEWVPAGENHLLKSTSIVQTIQYDQNSISYRTFDDASIEVIRAKSKPRFIKIGNETIEQRTKLDKQGWTWRALETGGVLKIRHETRNHIISKF